MRFVDVQGCPVPAKLAPFVRTLIRETGATLQSAYRGNDPAAVKILRKHGKKNQAELYRGFQLHLPGYLPANPPGRSTHELRGDGVAYHPRYKTGAVLPWWACGLDFDNAHVTSLIKAAARHGWKLEHFYTSASEYHHLNFKKPPLLYRLRRALPAKK